VGFAFHHDETVLGNGNWRKKVITNAAGTTMSDSCSFLNEYEQCLKQCVDVPSSERF
jgi:hypothetical protein